MNKSTTISILQNIKIFMVWNLIKKPKYLIDLFINYKKYCICDSFFPKEKHKKTYRIFIDQLIQTLRWGFPNNYYFPYGFDYKKSSEISQYLHYVPFMHLRDSLNNSPHSGIDVLRDKFLFSGFTKSLGIHSGENCGIISNDKTFNLETNKYTQTPKFLESLEGDYVFKPIDGECGSGIYLINVLKGSLYLDNMIIPTHAFIRKLNNQSYLVQKKVVQHPIMSSLHKQSLNTIRLVTIRDVNTSDIVVFPSILRIGSGNSFVDNTSQGGLAVAVNIQTGNLGEFGFYKPGYGTRVRVHPDSGIRFSDITIPYFKLAVEQALILHSMLPKVHSIGWDIAIGINGPVFIEGNDNWEINGPQICNGPLKKKFYALSIKA